jgi:ATP synthase protein I
MPRHHEPNEEASKRFGERLAAVEAARARAQSGDAQRAMAQGYRFLGEVVGGVLMGAGLGWFLDRSAGTAPWGLVGGLLIGTGFSIFVAVRSASRMTKDAVAKTGPLPSVSDDEDED